MDLTREALTVADRLRLFGLLSEAMEIDKMMLRLIRAGKMVGFYHEIGIAAAASVSSAAFLRRSDYLYPHYRGHGTAHMHAKGIELTAYVAEHLGREDGCCKGRSSYHFSFPEHRVYGMTGNVGANFPPAIGYGLAAKRAGEGDVVVTCSGEGAYGEGRAHEAMLICALWKLPVLFWCENNAIAQYSGIEDNFPSRTVSDLADGFNIHKAVVDGQDLFACAAVAKNAVDAMREGAGPIFVECHTLRPKEHNVGGLNMEGAKERDPALMERWLKERDPRDVARKALLDRKEATVAELDRIEADAAQLAEKLAERGERGKKATPPIWELEAQVYAR